MVTKAEQSLLCGPESEKRLGRAREKQKMVREDGTEHGMI